MEIFFLIVIVCLLAFLFYKFATSGNYTANDIEFKQAGVRVVFSTGKITIKNKTYDVKDVQGIESKASGKGKLIYIKVDDFNKPIHTISIVEFGNNAGEKFIQRLSTALRKAGGSSFY